MELTLQAFSTQKLESVLEKDINLVACHSDYSEGLKSIEVNKASVVLVEHDEKNADFEQLLKGIRDKSPESKIILLGEGISDEVILRYILCGIYGYLQLSCINEFLNKSIKCVHQGEAWFSRKLVSSLIESVRA